VKKHNGEGTIYKHEKTGKWNAQIYVTLKDGTRKRRSTSAADRETAMNWLEDMRLQERRNIPFSEKSWTVGSWMDHFLQNHYVRHNTMAIYERAARQNIKPLLGKIKLEKLSISDVQGMVDKMRSAGYSARTIQKTRQVLSAALSKAMRQELLFRNVAGARMLDMPEYSPKERNLWTVEETRLFLDAAQNHPWYFAFLLIFTYGLRCGEALGLRWSDIDFQKEEICIRQQIQRVAGELSAQPLKTKSSLRVLSLTPYVKEQLYRMAQENRIDLSRYTPDFSFSTENLITKSRVGTPVSSRNFSRALDILSKRAGVPRITPHVSRHMAATLCKDIGTPLKDTQGILGHSNSDMTQRIYQHGTTAIQKQALTAIDKLLHPQTVVATPRCSFSLQNCAISGYKKDPIAGIASPMTSVKSFAGLTKPMPKELFSSGFVKSFPTPVRNGTTFLVHLLQTRVTIRLLGSVAVMRCSQIHRGRQIRQLCRLILKEQ